MTGHEAATSDEVAGITEAGAQHAAYAAIGSKEIEEKFTRREIEQFDADDVVAGSTIGKMLALFFLYTVIVMSAVAWWTAHAVTGP